MVLVGTAWATAAVVAPRTSSSVVQPSLISAAIVHTPAERAATIALSTPVHNHGWRSGVGTSRVPEPVTHGAEREHDDGHRQDQPGVEGDHVEVPRVVERHGPSCLVPG